MVNRSWSVARRVLFVSSVTVLISMGLPGLRSTWGVRAAEQQTAANDLTNLMAQATKAVNGRQIDGLKPLLGEGVVGTFAWVPEAHETWEGAILPVPTATAAPNAGPDATAPEPLAVFHAWHSCQSDGDHVHRLISTPGGWRLGAEIPETETLGFRVRDHDLHITFDVPQKNATLTDTIQVERTADNLPSFGLLRISHDFKIRSITLGDAAGKSEVRFRQAGGVIAFAPPAARQFALTLHYTGHLDNRESDYIRANEAVLCSYWYPHIARLPAKTTVTATTPPDWKAMAQGELVKETQAADGATTVTYRNEVPNCFYTLDIGRYTITKRTVKSRTLAVYQLRPNPALAQSCLDTLAAAMDYYDRSFAPFPFTHYSIVETQGAFAGALEAYSFATFGPNTLPELIPHELAHTWWGGVIPCTYTRSMWDEAFAEYADDLFTRSREPAAANTSPVYPMPSRLLEERRKQASSYGALPVARAFNTEDDRHIAAGYEKGRQVLKMLEMQLGQPTMLRCMRRFFAAHPKGEAADWPEFEVSVQKETGTDYRWFFAEWLERTGIPALALAHTTAHKDNTGYLVETDVVQDGSPYRLELPILLETTAGQPLHLKKQVDGASTHLTFHTDAMPTRLRLDPRGEVLFAPPLGAPSGGNPTLFSFPQ